MNLTILEFKGSPFRYKIKKAIDMNLTILEFKVIIGLEVILN